MIQEFQTLSLFPLSAAEIVRNLLVALICGYLVSWLYRITYKGPGYSISFVNAMILLAMITALVIMVIGNNLARAFGLVGAMSIIRFRTALKETQDIVFIFFALAAGMAAGAGYFLIAFLGTIFIGIVILIITKTGLGVPRQREYLLQFSYTASPDAPPPYLPVIQKHCRRHEVINVRSLDETHLMEVSFYVRLKDEQQNDDFIRELSATSGVRNVNLFFDESYF